MTVQFLANGLCSAAVNSLIALGFGLIYFACRIFHIAHGAVYTLAGYVAWAAFVVLGWPLVLAFCAGMGAGVALGIIIELSVYYPLINPRRSRTASPAVAMMSSLGVYIVGVNLVAMIAGNDTKVLRPGVEKTVYLSGAILTHIQVVQLITAAVVLILFGVVLWRTQIGRTIRALADDPELVSIMGYNVRLLRLGVMAIGSALAGAGSILVAFSVGIDPHVGFPAVLIAAVATIVGGFGCLLAPALGALILGILQSIVIWQTSQKWAPAVAFGVLIVMLILRPRGILATVKRLEEQ